MIQDPRKNPDRHQNLVDSSLGHAPPLHKISSKFIKIQHNFLRYVAHTDTESDEYITSSVEERRIQTYRCHLNTSREKCAIDKQPNGAIQSLINFVVAFLQYRTILHLHLHFIVKKLTYVYQLVSKLTSYPVTISQASQLLENI